MHGRFIGRMLAARSLPRVLIGLQRPGALARVAARVAARVDARVAARGTSCAGTPAAGQGASLGLGLGLGFGLGHGHGLGLGLGPGLGLGLGRGASELAPDGEEALELTACRLHRPGQGQGQG